ncbi:MAG: hypothetical protein HYX87_00805 [Chloroflexi bacterium]|nr:hypothetical protein [Chloroflexota bacterium]
MNTLAWALPLAVFLLLFVPSLMIQSHSLYRRKADKVQEYETQAIELEPDIQQESRMGIFVFRVGIRVLGRKAIRGILVYLTHYDGQENGLHDAPLRAANRLRNTTGAITVNPGQTQRYVEVLHYRPSVPEMGIPYNLNYQLQELGVDIQNSPYSLPTKIDVGAHSLTLYATGEDISPIEREVKVTINDDKLEMDDK